MSLLKYDDFLHIALSCKLQHNVLIICITTVILHDLLQDPLNVCVLDLITRRNFLMPSFFVDVSWAIWIFPSIKIKVKVIKSFMEWLNVIFPLFLYMVNGYTPFLGIYLLTFTTSTYNTLLKPISMCIIITTYNDHDL